MSSVGKWKCKNMRKLVGEMLIDYKTILMMEPSPQIKFFREVSSVFPCGSSVSNERERNNGFHS